MPRTTFPIPRRTPSFVIAFLAIWSSGWLLVSVGMLFDYLEDKKTYSCIYNKGVTVDGVVSKTLSSGGNSWTISYRYTPADSEEGRYAGARGVHYPANLRFRRNLPVSVTYCSDDPSLSMMTDYIYRPAFSDLLISILFPLPLWLGGLFIAGLFLKMKIYRYRLDSQGINTRGMVTGKYGTASRSEKKRYVVSYTFSAQRDGEARRIFKHEYNRDLYMSVKVGDNIDIEYLETNPKICDVVL